MAAFTIVEGRLSGRYNHFNEYEFMSCKATQTRMMGVIALKVTWKGRKNPRDRYYQIVHLDYSEYGFDEYLEFECIVGSPEYVQNKEDMNYYWKHFTGSMGGRIVDIPPAIMLRLIETAEPLAADSVDREYDNAENREFRHHTMMRLDLMKESLASEGITSAACSEMAAIRATSPERYGTCELINYFIMRIIDHDYAAASYLSLMDHDKLRSCPLTGPGIQTLIRSRIRRSDKKTDPPADGYSYPYRVTVTTLGRRGYYHSSFIIWLSSDYRARDSLVTGIDVGSMIRLTEIESAIQVIQKEYITVFSCDDSILDGFDGRMISPLEGTEPVAVPNGWLYTIYKHDNSYVNSSDYRLGDDVYGYVLLTIGGQLVLMSSDVNNITHLDTSVMYSYYAPQMRLQGRYLLEKTPVFQTLCQRNGVYFEDLIDTQDE